MVLFRLIIFLIPLAFLVGCDAPSQNSSSTTPHKGLVALPALLIIQEAISELVPVVDGQRNDMMMSQVCALARGESTQEQVEQKLLKHGINLENVPRQGHPFSLLVSSDPLSRTTACAAYVATSVMTFPEVREFMSEDKSGVSDSKTGGKLTVDPKKLHRFLGVQLAVARADADFFALLATKLESTPGLTLEQYKKSAQGLFAKVALSYLRRIKSLYADGQSRQYSLLEYSGNYFRFASNDGFLFAYGHDGLYLKFNQVSWYGAGKILGKKYMLDVAYFDRELAGSL
ncbi:hypothetical protein ACOWPU_13020 [Pseudomonas aeruginosa]|uniref:hypothetical protein n=1 Tax=Pseudomonas aeruginosa TaxID=287 RepID=UPI000F83FB92|nr:hypothetical protein [Pseudomonas aeruginosa]MBG4922344.1 hypothetical protein [Pseudomonas aeruginosa]MBG5864599.1 hypothetical protein [Pseudomonas aeruginosa]RTX35875.1 hypothetical protein DZA21_11230 [Pseudomonas aeruginosa]HDU8925399.1 hypothetical protein [Pseudomonas aeruginosa]HDU9094058.1 hypothetical protein [Pseudomonas aeruginosa]